MRPKPPKNGKKILLERIKFIWNKMSFSKKVTARNIFRYKKRAIMTIVGIAGCTGLMLTGFGIRDSVVDIPDAQFKRIFKYEASVSLMNTDSLDDLEEYLNSNENVEDYCKIDPDIKMKEYKYGILYIREENEFRPVEIDAAFDYIPDESNTSVRYTKEPHSIKVKPVNPDWFEDK